MNNIILGSINKNNSERLKSIEESFIGCNHFPHVDKYSKTIDYITLGFIKRFVNKKSTDFNQIYTYNNLTITGTFRFDDRNELCEKIGIPIQERKEINDAFLICKSYEKWGEECVQYIYGDWAFAIWCNTKKELFLARDHFGMTGIYYYKTDSTFHFSSSISSLVAINSLPKEINKNEILKTLGSISTNTNTTVYKDIYKLPPAHYIKIDKDLNFNISRYWKMEEFEVKSQKIDDCIDNFNNLFQKAINSRLSDSENASTLSGGLDSSSITAIAADLLKKQNKHLSAITLVPFHEYKHITIQNRILDEQQLAEELVNMYNNIDHTLIQGKKFNHYDSILLSHHIQHAPIHASSNVFWIYEMLQLLKEQNISNLLIGQGGNGTISWTGENNLSQLKLIKNWIKESLFNSNQKTIQTEFDKIIENSHINKDFAKEYLLKNEIEKSKFDIYHKNKRINKRLRIINPKSSFIAEKWQENGYFFGVNIYDPSIDLKLTEHLLTIPNSYFSDSQMDRKIIRIGMKNKLPNSILLNKKRGLQGIDKIEKLKNEIIYFENLISSFEHSEYISEYLDIKKMKLTLQSIKSNTDSKLKLIQVSNLLRAVSIGIYIENFNSLKY
jgi:asparagine synthase (glutamine-hydrolysing)